MEPTGVRAYSTSGVLVTEHLLVESPVLIAHAAAPGTVLTLESTETAGTPGATALTGAMAGAISTELAKYDGLATTSAV